MVLIADGKEITKGTIEHCIYENNTMSMAERDTYNNVWIEENNKIIARLKIDGKEQYYSVTDYKKGQK